MLVVTLFGWLCIYPDFRVSYAQFAVSDMYPDLKVKYPDFRVSYAQFAVSNMYPDFKVKYPDFRVSYAQFAVSCI